MYSTLYKHILFPFYEGTLRRRKTLDYLHKAEAQQWLPAAGVREIQWRRLIELLQHAEQHVPFYRERMRKAGVTARGINSPDDVRKLPALTKQDIRENAEALVAENFRGKKLYGSGTTGSTGQPLQFSYDHAAYERRVAAAVRADRWTGWDLGCKQFHIWGRAGCAEGRLKNIKVQAHNRLRNMVMVNCCDYSDTDLVEYVLEYNRFEPVMVVGYASAVAEFARFCEARKFAIWSPQGVVVTAETAPPQQVEVIGRVFKSGVFNRYECREMMNIAAECDRHEGLHLNADNIYCELEQDGEPVGAGCPGEVVVTDLNNFAMPFIRYRVGDVAVAGAKPCSCGRGLPLLERVEGRVVDMIVARDGRPIMGLFFGRVLKDFPGVDACQTHQAADYSVTVRIVAGKEFEKGNIPVIERALREKLGSDMPLKLELVDQIPRTKGGKLQLAVSEVAR